MKVLLSPAKSLLALRIMISICMIAHASQRFYHNSINGFGDFLNTKGFLIGVPIAWGITLFELIGGLALLLNYFTKWISLVWALQLLMGIILVHAQHGWFVVGPSNGGVEYSLLLIVSLLVLHAHSEKTANKT
ncbi:DoxX family protein [Chryseotalea sanaruensis]|uniref:DoxX family protein n=1 Tax=Chryseotalea sanaruensis TaxID=2482724 RepID=A0A401U8F2_9BACT|nr:DoxX family protein [Chryseotalea sanaruensis]GCC51155.1 DoxX family protein [Chryseotalea sanaruensis]